MLLLIIEPEIRSDGPEPLIRVENAEGVDFRAPGPASGSTSGLTQAHFPGTRSRIRREINLPREARLVREARAPQR